MIDKKIFEGPEPQECPICSGEGCEYCDGIGGVVETEPLSVF